MYSGLGEAAVTQDPQATQQFYDEPASYPFDVTLTANQALKDLSQFFDRDSDFYWTGLVGTQTGAYNLRLQLPSGRFLSSAPVKNTNLVGTAQFPVPIFPAVRVPGGGKIGIEVTDTSGAGNTIQLVFIGIRRFRIG